MTSFKMEKYEKPVELILDERQMSEKNKAYKYAYFVFVAYIILNCLLYYVGFIWTNSLIGCAALGFMLSQIVFNRIIRRKNAFTNNEEISLMKRKKYTIPTVCLTCLCYILMIGELKFFSAWKLTFTGIGIIITVITVIEEIIVYRHLKKQIAESKEMSE